MAFYFCIVSLLLAIVVISNVSSSCMRSELVVKVTKYGNVDKQCVYNDIKVLPGSSFKLAFPDCLDCKCTKSGMACCGFGYAAGVVVPPEGCVAHNDACKLIFIKKNNSTEECKTATPAANNKKKPSAHRKP